MSTIFYEPFYDIDRLFDAVSPLITGATTDRGRRPVEGEENVVRTVRPRMDLHENRDTNTVTAFFELPGVRKEDVNIDLQAGRLTVTAESKPPEDLNKEGYAIRERRYGKFSRTLQVPPGIKEDQIKANMENGILKVEFPKSPPEAAPKKINIS
ncbi:putative small heat shock protein (HSP20) family protein [Lyophyllum shimeji]|uniref:Small heat shock protein (HSP20) family protein n=1 Tax=Lyophyllum shimeji TaxID=47721 RepID=A0A9P3PF63_LYOSH|nr:putative small heat shock protein (HSP20) family protein [Lyophyllum shimeji]